MDEAETFLLLHGSVFSIFGSLWFESAPFVIDAAPP